MNHLTRLFSLLLASLLFAIAPLRAVENGQPAPDFTLTDIEGQAVQLSELRGKVVVLEWVNPECPFVKNHYENTGNLPTLQQEARAAGAIWLSINSGHPGAQGDFTPEQVHAWAQRTGAAPTHYLRDADGKVGHLYGAKTTPHLFIISAQGVLVYQGAIDSIRTTKPEETRQAINYVRTTLAALAAGQPVAPDKTPAYGCSVKY